MKTLHLLVSAVMAIPVAAAETPATATAPESFLILAQPAAPRVPPVPPFTSVEAMHGEFYRRFEDSPGFGLSRVVQPRFLAPTPALVLNGTTYPVAPPELVALEDDAVVYAPRPHAGFRTGISTNVTRREVRKLFKHRPLTSHETNAVLALRAGRDLVVLTNRVAAPEAEVELLQPTRADGSFGDPNASLLVFGALRASETCAVCHQCEKGTLLGAFAYRLTPAAMPPVDGSDSPALRSNLVARVLAD